MSDSSQHPLFNVATSGGLAATDPSAENLDFAYPGDFSPSANGRRTAASPLDLEFDNSFTAAAAALATTPVPLDLPSVVENDLKGVVGLLEANVMAALHRIGVSVGAVDVAALKGPLRPGCAASSVPPPASSPLLVG